MLNAACEAPSFFGEEVEIKGLQRKREIVEFFVF